MSFLVGAWNRLCYEYTEAVREGVRTLIRLLPEGATRDSFVALALSPHRGSGKRLWRWPNVFSFSASSGYWRGRLLPEIEEQLETARIMGSSQLRSHTIPVNDPGTALPKETNRRNRKKKEKPRTQTGGKENTQPGDAPPVDNPANSYPLGKRLRSAEFEASKKHCPRDSKSGKTICWNFNSNSGCTNVGDVCPYGLHHRIKPGGLHWTVRAQIARRGGFKGTKLLSAAEIDGFIAPLRQADLIQKNEKEFKSEPSTNTGGYTTQCETSFLSPVVALSNPPGLGVVDKVVRPTAVFPGGMEDSLCAEEDDSPIPTNPFIGTPPADINSFNFTLLEDDFRTLLYGQDDWLIPPSESTSLLVTEVDNRGISQEVDRLFESYAPLLDPSLYCVLLNWINLRTFNTNSDFEAELAAGLKNVMVHGNSFLRLQANKALANLQCLDRFHAGDGGVCRIWWGDSIKLDDCLCQPVSIGKLHFTAVDFGDIIHLNEFLQRKLVSPDREEKNQCTLLAVAAGLLSFHQPASTIPSRKNVAHTALELRIAEWQKASPFAESLGTARSSQERNLLSLCHDILHPNHDRDYRSMSLFLSEILTSAKRSLRIFDILHSGSGDTVLQINVIGSLDPGDSGEYIDLLATGGHMRWLKKGNETLPADAKNWLVELSDFVYVHPFLNADEVFDIDKGVADSTPWLTCRQCRRREKGALTPSSF